ncbi:MAG: isopentenyl-diphosphate delta-isomerase, partial [Bdellovibrionales bacterium]
MGDFAYEPLLSGHPTDHENIRQTFLSYNFDMPLWISSMTGGTQKAHQINHNLARACGKFKLGMGLGSCRPLLENSDRFDDFNVKHLMGDAPLFTNFGIAQLEQLIEAGALGKVEEVTKRLEADGVIIHVNPLQEWAQVEGDRYKVAPLDTIRTLCDQTEYPIIVKEVGQGMGPQSLKALLELPIKAIELAGYGGTNFSILEQRRKVGEEFHETPATSFGYIGHTAEQMIEYLNTLQKNQKTDVEIIISGGIKDPVTGHILKERLEMNAVIGMASSVLKHAMGEYEDLQKYLHETKECFAMAKAFIKKSTA